MALIVFQRFFILTGNLQEIYVTLFTRGHTTLGFGIAANPNFILLARKKIVIFQIWGWASICYSSFIVFFFYYFKHYLSDPARNDQIHIAG
jgi:hypothetical protein